MADTIKNHRNLPVTLPAAIIAAFFAALYLCACADGMKTRQTEQGLFGKFTVYGPPHVLQDCSAKIVQADKDSCRKQNERNIEEPFQGSISIKNLGTGESITQALDDQGAYRNLLTPGEYEICVGEECSDPLEVKMRVFSTYGQRLPRPAAKAGEASSSAPAAESAASGVTSNKGGAPAAKPH